MSITRSKFTEGTVGLTLEAEKNFALVQGRISLAAEVKWGKSGSDTQQYNWSIPPKSKIHVVYGARAVNTYGVIKTYSNGKVTKTVNVTPKYSIGRHYKKTETKL
ncbi:hypothetical protein ACFVR2_20015 [Gottfriedia sp. NPDC057991]|uniref:hypothetical protein n=1 Tax=Gottfriedia sp. NPDC057991 TaxID=3346298 RepID=UPI0036DD3A20